MIHTKSPPESLEQRYDRYASEYCESLPLEHFMESTAQAEQRKITVESLDLVKLARPDVHVFSELLVQYPLPRKRRPGQVVPDNMIVVHDGKVTAKGSYNMPLQPVGPFWVLEYISKSNKRKDNIDNMRRYEKDLKVPYYLMFDHDEQELSLYRHNGKKYLAVKPNEHGRLAVQELELEVAIHDSWVRFWHRGELLPLPADLKSANDSLRDENTRLRKQLAEALAKKNGHR